MCENKLYELKTKKSNFFFDYLIIKINWITVLIVHLILKYPEIVSETGSFTSKVLYTKWDSPYHYA